MSEIGKAIDQIVKEGLAPALKKDGYKKVSRTFYREQSETIHIVNVQASQSDVGEQGQFTLNLGVYSAHLSKVLERAQPKDLPKEYECTIRRRIGQLMPDGKDYWWRLPADRGTLINDLVVGWSTFGKKWLDTIKTDEDIFQELLKDGPSFEVAKIFLHKEDRPAATRCVAEIVTKFGQINPNYVRVAENWARVNNLALNG